MHGWLLPDATEDCFSGQINAVDTVEGTIWRGHPVGFLRSALGILLNVGHERAVGTVLAGIESGWVEKIAIDRLAKRNCVYMGALQQQHGR
jgi:hypothetical protein